MRMAHAKRRDQWDHTANLLALLININRDPSKGSPATADKIHPFREELVLTYEEKREALKEQLAILKDRAFAGRGTVIPPFIPVNRRLQAPG